MSSFLLDSNIFIYHLYDSIEVHKFFASKLIMKDSISYSFITKIELLSFPKLSISESNKIIRLLDNFNKISMNDDMENIIISLRKNKQIKIPDAIIAASAIYSNSTLVTRNVLDFKNIENLKLYNPFDN